jgi:hypothetical protein
LKKLADKDPSYFVEADATHAWAQTRSRDVAGAAETEKFLLAQLKRDSYLDVLRAGALRGLAELPGVGRGERPQAMATLIEWTKRGKAEDARIAAVVALGSVAKSAVPAERARILELFNVLADEDDFRLRMRLVQALGECEAPEAASILEKIHRLDLDGRVRRDALTMRDAVLSAGSAPESVAQLKEQLAKLEEEQRKLRSQFEERGARV